MNEGKRRNEEKMNEGKSTYSKSKLLKKHNHLKFDQHENRKEKKKKKKKKKKEMKKKKGKRR